jgi:aminopeptidase N
MNADSLNVRVAEAGRLLRLGVALLSLVTSPAFAQQPARTDAELAPVHPPEISGGPLLAEQASYDVRFYDLALRINPADSTIAGALTVYASVVQPLSRLVLDLDTVFTVSAITRVGAQPEPLTFERRGGRLWITVPTLQPGERIAARIEYGGRPRSGRGGGFVWSVTGSGAPWLGVSCEVFGGDLWWPVKDHPSDEPDSLALHFTVPSALVAVSNGRLRGVRENGDGTHTYDWFVSTPINNYDVTLNVAPFVTVTTPYRSIAGDTIPVTFWALPEDSAKARAALPEFLDHLRFFEDIGGPYPFRRDKYGIVETSYLGMEHQTIISYGANFQNNAMAQIDWGFDALHQHELAHEWFGNMITPPDFNDLWLHEAFAQYMQPLYAERRLGVGKARELMALARARMRDQNPMPIASRRSLNSREAYSADIYWKGSWVLHTLRYLIGTDRFLSLLHQWANPDSSTVFINEACRCRFATTDDFVRLASRVAGRDLGWFFELYVRQPVLPRLVVTRQRTTVELHWEVPDGLPFPMPVDLQVDGKVRRVEPGADGARLTIPANATVQVDPDNWILRSNP